MLSHGVGTVADNTFGRRKRSPQQAVFGDHISLVGLRQAVTKGVAAWSPRPSDPQLLIGQNICLLASSSIVSF